MILEIKYPIKNKCFGYYVFSSIIYYICILNQKCDFFPISSGSNINFIWISNIKAFHRFFFLKNIPCTIIFIYLRSEFIEFSSWLIFRTTLQCTIYIFYLYTIINISCKKANWSKFVHFYKYLKSNNSFRVWCLAPRR